MSPRKTYDSAAWMSGMGPLSDIVISTRVRLARNVKSLPFPTNSSTQMRSGIADIIKSAVKATKAMGSVDVVIMSDLSNTYRQVLVEEHLISPQQSMNADNTLAITNRDKSLSIMVNEEDHIRIQAITSGLAPLEALKLAQDADDALEEGLDYAFDEKWGYLTACPTNLGTGLRASVMLHLPALAMLNITGQVLGAVAKMGLTIRGMFGEGTEATGNIIQMSNTVSLGRSEEEIVKHIEAVARQIVDRELDARASLKRDSAVQLEDRLKRAYGIATNAYVISTDEALRLLSDVKLGCDIGIIDEVDKNFFANTIVNIMPAHIEKKAGRELSPAERDIERAKLIKEALKPSKKEG